MSGTGTVDLTALTESSGDSAFALKGAAGTSVSVKTAVPVASSKEDATPVYMALLPGTWTGTLTITTVIGDFVFNLSGKQFKRSEMKTINVDLNNATVKPEPGLKGTKVNSYDAIRNKQASDGSKVLKDSDFGSGCHYYFYGIVVGGCDNANMDQNLQCGTTVDGIDVLSGLYNEAGKRPNANDIFTTENDRTNYLQSDGASYGFRLKFASPKQNIYKRGDKLYIYLAGLTLINEGAPTRYTLSIPEDAKILLIDRWSETTLNNHSKNYITPVAISSLTPEMIYTNVRISDVEFQVKRGCYANVREYDAILNPINKGLAENDARYGANNNYAKDGAANLLYDGSGKGIYMLLNMNSDWRWDASARVRKQVPQGMGTVSGILVHQPMERWGGNVGTYSIRPLKEEDIVCTGTSSWHDWVEWTYNHIDDVSNSKYYWNDNTATAGGYVSSSGGARFRQNKLNAVVAAGMVNESGAQAQLYCENTSDWGSSDTWRVIPVYVDRGFDVSSYQDAYKEKESMKNKHHHFGLVASGIHYKVRVRVGFLQKILLFRVGF